MGTSALKQIFLENQGYGPGLSEEITKTLPHGYNGEIRLFPFDPGELPGNWYFCNGDRFGVESPPGVALLSLSPAFKARWGIAVIDGTINVPKLFDGNGYGYFLRAVDGTTRLVGSAQADAIRNIVAYAYSGNQVNKDKVSQLSGAFTLTKTASNMGFSTSSYANGDFYGLGFDASLVVPTAEENRPINIGMIPAILLR
jgi:hypothetical protein